MTTPTLYEAAQQALEQLDFLGACYPHKTATDTATALRAALAAQQAAPDDVVRARLCAIASIAHAGGSIGLSIEDAQNEIRRLSLPHWDRSVEPKEILANINAAMARKGEQEHP